MSAIVGVVAFSDAARADEACSALLRQLGPYGPHACDMAGNSGVALGRCLYRTLPEDRFDRQPWSSPASILHVADARIDNRSEVAEALRISPAEAAGLADSTLLFIALDRWGDEALDRIEGDFAAARWSAAAGSLTLVRSPLSMKPLYMASTAKIFAFSTMPEPLTRLPEVGRAPDMDVLARIVTLAPREGNATAYRGIERVLPGEMVKVSSAGVSRRRLWNPPAEPVSGRSLRQSAEEMRALLDCAVAARIRRGEGQLGAHLSAGRDSSAVATSAACLAGPSQVLAFTGAPRQGYDLPVFPGWSADESTTAAATARIHPGITHIVCRQSAPFDLGRLAAAQEADQRPMYQPSQLPWWWGINDRAAIKGVSVMLVGSLGNLTISAGGQSFLPDLLRTGGLMPWLSQARRLGGSSWRGWRSVLHGSLGPRLPLRFYRLLRSAAGKEQGISLPILQQPYRAVVEAAFGSGSDDRPPASALALRREMLLGQDKAEKLSLRLWGIDVRDPTADRRLAEFCLTLPPEQLVDGPHGRPVFDLAFGERLDPQVLKPERRGYQQADWHELFRPDDVRRAFRDYTAAAPAVGELIDLAFVETLLDRWPMAGWDRWEQVQLYRDHLLTALAVAEFLHRLSLPASA